MILVVEDDSTVQNLIVTALETQEYRYCTAQDGTQAILEAATQRPDIMLLDLGLPDMDGVEVIQKVRTWSDLPIIVISARTEDNDKDRRAGRGRRRLPDQAVFGRRAAGTAARDAAAAEIHQGLVAERFHLRQRRFDGGLCGGFCLSSR